MRYIKVKVSPGELGFICKMITEYEGKIEIGSPLYLCDDGTVTPIENGAKVVGTYDVSNVEGDKISQRKETIELLEKNVIFWDNEGEGKIVQLPRADYDQVLAFFKEQPSANKFRETCAKFLREFEIVDAAKNLYGVRDILLEACDRLKASKASRKELVVKINELMKFIREWNNIEVAIEKAQSKKIEDKEDEQSS